MHRWLDSWWQFKYEVIWYYRTMKWVLFNIETHLCTLSGEPCGKYLNECCEVCDRFDNR
jgi:hypothetical protein